MSVISCTPDASTTGYSSYCLRGQHVTCASVNANCTCPKHYRLPPKDRLPKEKPVPTEIKTIKIGNLTVTVGQAPPPKTRGVVADILEVMAQTPASSREWLKIDFPASSSANSARSRLRTLDDAKGWELESRSTKTSSCLYLRRKG